MPRVDISQLSDQSRIWIFGISPALDAEKSARLLSAVDSFLDRWAAHGQPIGSARDLLEGSFLVIAIDRQSETSGCSIDRMFNVLQQLEHDLGASILDPNRIFYRDERGAVRTMSRSRFREAGSAQTVVFDTVAERLGAVRSGEWQRTAQSSWHRHLLG